MRQPQGMQGEIAQAAQHGEVEHVSATFWSGAQRGGLFLDVLDVVPAWLWRQLHCLLRQNKSPVVLCYLRAKERPPLQSQESDMGPVIRDIE